MELNEHHRRKRDEEDKLLIRNIDVLSDMMKQGFGRMDAGFGEIRGDISHLHRRIDELQVVVLRIDGQNLPDRVEELEGKEKVRNRNMGIVGGVGIVIGGFFSMLFKKLFGVDL